MIKVKPKAKVHTENCVKKERPQNKNLVPFKPGAEWRGNRDGRPKILMEESAKWLRETREDGKTNARAMIESIGSAVFVPQWPHSVSALRAIREIAEPTAAEEQGSTDREFTRLVVSALLAYKAQEKKADAIEV